MNWILKDGQDFEKAKREKAPRLGGQHTPMRGGKSGPHEIFHLTRKCVLCMRIMRGGKVDSTKSLEKGSPRAAVNILQHFLEQTERQALGSSEFHMLRRPSSSHTEGATGDSLQNKSNGATSLPCGLKPVRWWIFRNCSPQPGR